MGELRTIPSGDGQPRHQRVEVGVPLLTKKHSIRSGHMLFLSVFSFLASLRESSHSRNQAHQSQRGRSPRRPNES
jgi:hypothetical protein